jgi:uncharacterized protein (DUF58 family)
MDAAERFSFHLPELRPYLALALLLTASFLLLLLLPLFGLFLAHLHRLSSLIPLLSVEKDEGQK